MSASTRPEATEGDHPTAPVKAAKCWATGKTKFLSKADSRNALKHMKRISATLRSYHCPDCNGWHLTKGR